MNFTVAWDEDAENDLMNLWIAAADRQAITE
jgi:hypothetical protein